MTIQEIPITNPDGDPFDFQTVLDGVKYWLSFQPNVRGNYWVLSVFDASHEPILRGQRAVINYPLLLHCTSEKRPPGALYLVDLADTGVDPTLDDMGDRVRLMYDPDGYAETPQ